jgi:hypothetical protein
MIMTPARRHWLKATAAEKPATRQNANGYELMLAKLDEDRRRLHAIQSTQRKVAVKRELLPEYSPWVDGVIKGDHGQQDDVFMTVMLWRIDIGDLAGALPLARYAIRHALVMPDRFKRSVGCLLAEEFADNTLLGDPTHRAAGADALAECLALVADQDMPDEVRAKLHKARAYALLACQDVTPPMQTEALAHLQTALLLHDKVGVKKDIEQLERELKRTQAAAPVIAAA